MFIHKIKSDLGLLAVFGALFILIGCAGGEQQVQEGLDNYEYDEEGISNYEAANGGDNFATGNYDYGNEAGGDDYGSNYGENYGSNSDDGNYGNYGGNLATDNTATNSYGANNAGGELVNNAFDDELFTNETLTDSGITGQALNNTSTDSELMADATLVNSGSYNPAAEVIPAAGQSANALPPMDGGYASGPSTPPPAGGIVKYIMGDVSMLDQPGGSAVKTLYRGDHPVVYDMGEYHQTMEGYVIPSTSLSTEATGRPRNPGYWR